MKTVSVNAYEDYMTIFDASSQDQQKWGKNDVPIATNVRIH